MRKDNLLKRILAAAAVVVMSLNMCGCDKGTAVGGENVSVSQPDAASSDSVTRPYLPIKKADGSKFRVAYVDIDPYNVTFRQLYYAIENLKIDGWLDYDELPFDPEVDGDTQALVNWLVENDRSEYMEFVSDANYYTYFDPEIEEEIKQSLIKHVTVDKDIDLIITMGTSPSALVKSLNLDIPLLMYGVSDAIGSGLINSAEDSGGDYLWAHVDPSAYSRQMQYYFDTFQFTNIGAVYGDEIVASMPEYRKVAEKNGFKITEQQLTRVSGEEESYYSELKKIFAKMINQDKVDAFILTTNVFVDEAKAKELLNVFVEAGIPVFAQIGSNFVIEGAALMIVDTRDAVRCGPFISNIIGSVFNGALPGELEQEYISSPYLTFNLDVADKIDYKPSFDMLIACEKIICTE